jgi:hypothetical protein
MLTLFMAIIRTFLDSGFGAALIQKKEITQTDICSIFYFNILVGLAAAGLLCLFTTAYIMQYNRVSVGGDTRHETERFRCGPRETTAKSFEAPSRRSILARGCPAGWVLRQLGDEMA